MKLGLDTVNLAYYLNESDSRKKMDLGVWKTIYYEVALLILILQIVVTVYLIKNHVWKKLMEADTK